MDKYNIRTYFTIFSSRDASRQAGQSVVEIIVGMTIGVVLIGVAAGTINVILKMNYDVKTTQIAANLAQEFLDNVQVISESDWLKIYCPPDGACPGVKGPSSQFYPIVSGNVYAIMSGATTTAIEDKNFTRYFSIENVNRDSCGVGDITADTAVSCSMEAGAGYVAEDPSTQKITATVSWGNGRIISKTQYFTRNRGLIFKQTDWSGGFNQESFATSSGSAVINNKFSTSTGIDYSTSTGAIIIQGF